MSPRVGPNARHWARKRWKDAVGPHRRTLIAYTLLGIALWPVPLLGRMHMEASAVVAFFAFFVAGLAALSAFQGGGSFRKVLVRQELFLVVPLVLLTTTLLWQPNCDYGRGLLLYLAMPPPTVAFAVGLAYVLTGWGMRFGRWLLVGAGGAISLVGPLYDLGWHPQFYTYNHLFGGVLGPIYDRELALRVGFFAFRTLTLLWALLFFLLGQWLRAGEQRSPIPEAASPEEASPEEAGSVEGPRSKPDEQGDVRSSTSISFLRAPRCENHAYLLGALVTGLLIGAAYLNAARLGFNTPAWYLQEELGGHRRTAHFDLYYDPAAVSDRQLDRLAEDHEWHYRWLKDRLGTAPTTRVASYLYPSEAVKARLTGARRTSVAPVWLDRPQTHLLMSAYAQSFGHELVHAFSRNFGLPVLNASRSVGLVEGLAVAFEPPSGRPGPADQVSAAALLEVGDRQALSLAEGVAARLSPLGFWTGRGAVSYTTMGAFVRFLAERYGADKLRAVYAWARFEEVYGKPVRTLAEEWEEALLRQPVVARAAGMLAARRFSRPSLFEARCPHYVPSHVRAYRAGRRALGEGDTTAALAAFRRALQGEPAFEAARISAARVLLGHAAPLEPLRLLQAAPDSVHGSAFALARADAQALAGRPAAARQSYERALERLALYRHEARALVALRRALIGQPRLLRALVGPGTPLQRARRLAEARETLPPAAGMLRALLLAEGGRFTRAARLLDRPVPALHSEQARLLVRRQRLAWRARLWYRAGQPGRAEGYARRAAQAYRTVGDRDAAARWETFAAKMRWAAA